MELEKLGYTQNWIEFNFLTKELLAIQFEELEQDADNKPEQYRFFTFLDWLEAQESLTNKDIANYMTLALEDPHQKMAGTAVRHLFISPILTNAQFDALKPKIAKFGEWTKKLIDRETLSRQLKQGKITNELYLACLQYKMEFGDNRLLVKIIETTGNVEILTDFETNGCGKRMRTLAEKRLKQLERQATEK